MNSDTVIISGALAQRYRHGGHAWVFLQYLLGFKELGWKPVFVDWLEPSMCADLQPGQSIANSANYAWLREVMVAFGLEDSYAVLDRTTGVSYGMPRHKLIKKVAHSELLINVMGYLQDEELLAAASLPVFLDIDPGFSQMWHANNQADIYGGHKRFVTVGANIGTSSCNIPTCGIDWIHTPQPVVLSEWPVSPLAGSAFTTVATWRGPFTSIDYDQETYGLRVHEFRRFAELPAGSSSQFEMALNIHHAETPDLEMLEQTGWRLRDPDQVAADPHSYRRYIQGSMGEFTVAKNLYVKSNSGWFSDRSICYLASGRPVIAQDTGIKGRYDDGEGLLLFSSPGEANAAVEEVAANTVRHGATAREIAEEHFRSDRVLTDLLTEISG